MSGKGFGIMENGILGLPEAEGHVVQLACKELHPHCASFPFTGSLVPGILSHGP